MTPYRFLRILISPYWDLYCVNYRLTSSFFFFVKAIITCVWLSASVHLVPGTRQREVKWDGQLLRRWYDVDETNIAEL